jgi:hypothetical protein
MMISSKPFGLISDPFTLLSLSYEASTFCCYVLTGKKSAIFEEKKIDSTSCQIRVVQLPD